MKTAICAALLAALALGAGADEAKKPQAAAAPQGMPPMPKLGPEQAVLKSHVGTWDATIEMWTDPSQPPTTSKGVDTTVLGPGGFSVLTDYQGEFMGAPFTGHGVMTYDAARQKYVGTWLDSMTAGIGISHGTYDAAKKTMTDSMEGPDLTGKIAKMKTVTEWKDADTRVFSMYNPVGSDGKEAVGMRITYQRRK